MSVQVGNSNSSFCIRSKHFAYVSFNSCYFLAVQFALNLFSVYIICVWTQDHYVCAWFREDSLICDE